MKLPWIYSPCKQNITFVCDFQMPSKIFSWGGVSNPQRQSKMFWFFFLFPKFTMLIKFFHLGIWALHPCNKICNHNWNKQLNNIVIFLFQIYKLVNYSSLAKCFFILSNSQKQPKVIGDLFIFFSQILNKGY